MRKLFVNLFWTLNLLAAVMLLAAFLSPFINPNHISLFAYFGIGFPLFLYANIFFVVFWLFFKRKYLWLSLVILILGYPLIRRHVQIFPERTTLSKDGVKVMSYNVRNFAQQGRKQTKSTIKSIKNLIEKQNLDVVCFQEFRKTNTPESFLNIKSLKAYGKGANIIYTKLKVINQGNLIDKNDDKFGVYVDAILSDDTIRIVNIQLLSYSVSKEIEAYEKTEKVNRKQFFFTVASKLNRGFTKRVSETNMLQNFVKQTKYPLIVCGDFNDPPASFTYQEIIKTGLQDAFIESGNGYGNTYNWSFPKVRIDYILTSSDFDLYNYKVLYTSLSDHLPIEALFIPKQ